MASGVETNNSAKISPPSSTDGKIEQNIILALDSSEQAENAIKWYINHAHRPGNKLIFLHCIELPEMKLDEAKQMHMSPGVLATMWKEEERKTKLLEEKMKMMLKEKSLSGVLRTVTGKPGEMICRIAEDEQAVMVVMGTHGAGMIRRTILGSVSDYVVNHAHCPVTICRTRTGKSRRPSGGDAKKRHSSGDSIKNFFTFGRSRSLSGDSEKCAEGHVPKSPPPVLQADD